MLSNEQIEKLFSFCRKHYIHYYEVQAEIVDHFADAIEKDIADNPSVSFEQALDRVYNNFGGWKGMQKIQQERQKAIGKQHAKLKREIFLSYFKPPKILLVLCIAALSFFLLNYVDGIITQVLVPVTVIVAMFWEARHIWKFNRKFKVHNKQLLILQQNDSVVSLIISIHLLSGLIGHAIQRIAPDVDTAGRTLPFFILLPLYVVMVNCYREYLEKIYTKATDLYPEVFAKSEA